MNKSSKLLTEFSLNGSEEAFRKLVEGHVSRVYSTALRLLAGDSHAAQDVTQIVFTDLARQAKALRSCTILEAWLHRHTCFLAMKWMRTEQRRRLREHAAAEMNAEHHTEANLTGLRAALDQAINALRTKDRIAILLRYFEAEDFEAIGQALHASPTSAQRRVSRALEKLRILLGKKGHVIPSAALIEALSGELSTAAPLGLASTVSAHALAGAAYQTLTPVALLKFAAMNKLKLTVAALVLALGTTVFLAQRNELADAREQNARLREKLSTTQTNSVQLSNQIAQAVIPIAQQDQTPELLRLRAQVTDALNRADKAERALAVRPINEVENPERIPRDRWLWRGFATPENTFQTVVHAMSQGDLGTLLASSTAEGKLRLQDQFAGKSTEEIEVLLKNEIGGLPAIRLDRKKQESPNEVAFTLNVEEHDDGTTRTRDEAVMRFVSNGQSWLYAP